MVHESTKGGQSGTRCNHDDVVGRILGKEYGFAHGSGHGYGGAGHGIAHTITWNTRRLLSWGLLVP
eukprot:scaffold421267_cov60-Attheya_sp.AAC.2